MEQEKAYKKSNPTNSKGPSSRQKILNTFGTKGLSSHVQSTISSYTSQTILQASDIS